MRNLDPAKMGCEGKLAVFRSKQKGKIYFFFSLFCREFDENPVHYFNFRGGV
jgi:YHS domain-containing protein